MKRSYRANDPESRDPDEWPPAKVALYEAAVELFALQGVERTSMQEIVSLAGLTKGALYHYFGSKDALVEVVAHRAADITTRMLRDKLKPEMSARQAIHEIIFHTIGAIEQYRREMAVFMDQWRLHRDALPHVKQKREDYESIVVGVIEKGIADGEFRAIASPKVIAFALFGLCMHAQYWWRPNDPLGAAELSRVFETLFVDGLEMVQG